MLPCTKRRKEVPDVKRSHIIRLHPTPEQEVYFRKACGVARHAYNWALARWKDCRAEGTWAKIKDLKAEYNRSTTIGREDHERGHFLSRRLVVRLHCGGGGT